MNEITDASANAVEFHAPPYPRPVCDDQLTPELLAALAADPAVLDIVKERLRQILRWGDQSSLHPGHLFSLLMEEVGEAACHINDLCHDQNSVDDLYDLYTECSHVAAVALQIMQIADAKLSNMRSPLPTAAALDAAAGRL